MSILLRFPFKHFSAGVSTLALGLAQAAGAQIVRDGSLGPDTSLQTAGSDYVLTQEMGALAGDILFHNFSHFGVGSGERASFTGAPDVANLIASITGGEISRIDGALRSEISGAALYLFSPQGVVFGAFATLDLQGGLHISTASQLAFADGAELEAAAAVPSV